MMKICPVCDRPATDLIRLEDILMCSRCSDAVDVEPALRNLDAAEWKDPSRSRSGKTAVGAPIVTRRNLPRWAAAAAVPIFLGIVAWAVIPSEAPLAPPVSAASRPVGTPRVAEMEPPARPPEGNRPETTAERIRRILGEARPRVRKITAARRDGVDDVGALLEQAVVVERQLRHAAAPENAELASLQAALYAGLGRYEDALGALKRRRAADPGNADARFDLLQVMISVQVTFRLDEPGFPEVVKALRSRIAARFRGPVPEDDPLSAAYAHVVEGEFSKARSLLEEDQVPPARRPEMAYVRAILAYLSNPGPTRMAAFRRFLRSSTRTALTTPEIPIWLMTVRRLSGRESSRPTGTKLQSWGSPVHVLQLRWAASDRERGGDVKGALALLDQALRAVPRDLPLRLDRARLLVAAGEKNRAIEAYEAAAGVAATMGLSEAAIREISALKRA